MTGILELIAVQNLFNGTLLAGLWHSNKKAQRRESLMRWKMGPKPMPLVDRLLEKKFVPRCVTQAQRKNAKRISGILRSVANTKAFDLLVLAGMTDGKKFDRWMSKAQKVANRIPGLAGGKK